MTFIAEPRAIRPYSEHIVTGFDQLFKGTFHLNSPDSVGYVRTVDVSTTFETPDVLNTFSCWFGYIQGCVPTTTITSVMGMKYAVNAFLYKGFANSLYYFLPDFGGLNILVLWNIYHSFSVFFFEFIKFSFSVRFLNSI